MPRRGGIRIDSSQVRANLDTYGRQTRQRAGVGMQVLAAQSEVRAKADRRWTDRTGAAVQSITGSYEETAENIRAALAIGVDYGIFLEKANGGKYDIVWPTVQKMRPQLLMVARIALTAGGR